MSAQHNIDNSTSEIYLIQSGTASGLRYQDSYPFDMRAFIDDKSTFSPLCDFPQFKRLDYDDLIELEKATYEKNKEYYLSLYEGKYIALLNGVLLGYDNDFSNLATRVFEKYPNAPVFIPRVTRKETKHRIMSMKTDSPKLI